MLQSIVKLIIASMRRMGKVIVSACLSVYTWGVPWPDMGYPQPVPHLEMGYNPVQGWGPLTGMGYPPFREGVPPSRDGLSPHPGMGHSCAEMGYLPSRDGVSSPSRDGGTPPIQRWVPPGLGQQMGYLIHGRWYASCVHAGGLSC